MTKENAMNKDKRRIEYTLASPLELSGVGLHSGEVTHVRVLPGNPGEGRYFVRVDLPDRAVIAATVDSVCQTTLSTELSNGVAKVRTVEHLLAALWGSRVDNACIEIDGPEIPLLDGSAKNWVDSIDSIGLISQELHEEGGSKKEEGGRVNHVPKSVKLPSLVTEPIWIRQGDAFVAAIPSSETRFSYGIDFDLAAIGNQWYSWATEGEAFADAIAPARTFGLAHQIDQLREAGLIKGGSLENALVCDASGWINPPLRFPNEPVRHKILDLVGDLSLLGTLPIAHYLAYKASHHLHIQLAKALNNPDNFP
jgi:UDP-3-O-[3-hydroxymyristoyl] N-acetylglucosamine deacetylase